jgi:hypothetical protein
MTVVVENVRLGKDVRLGEEIAEGVGGARVPSSKNTCGVKVAARRSHVSLMRIGENPQDRSCSPLDCTCID